MPLYDRLHGVKYGVCLNGIPTKNRGSATLRALLVITHGNVARLLLSSEKAWRSVIGRVLSIERSARRPCGAVLIIISGKAMKRCRITAAHVLGAPFLSASLARNAQRCRQNDITSMETFSTTIQQTFGSYVAAVTCASMAALIDWLNFSGGNGRREVRHSAL